MTLKRDEPVSNFAFNFNVRRYNEDEDEDEDGEGGSGGDLQDSDEFEGLSAGAYTRSYFSAT